MADRHPLQKKEKSTNMKSPSRQESKALKRKLFSSVSAIPEDNEKRSTKHSAKKKKPLSRPTSPVVLSSTTPSRGGTSGRPIPLSERQQLALLMQMTSGENSPEANPKQQSPTTPSMSSTAMRTQPVTPTSSITSSGGKTRVNKRNEKGETQLHTAAIKGDIQATKSLIKQGADVNCQDFAGWTPLHEACNHGFYDIAKQLLKAGANVNVQGLNDITPLHDAAVNGHIKVVELLLKHGANPLQANNLGQTPLAIARSQQIIQLLKNEIICSSSDLSTPEARSPTSPESSSTEGDMVLDAEGDCNRFSSVDDNLFAVDSVMNREVNRIREEVKGGTDSAAESTATGSSNAEQMLRLHELDSRESSPDRFRLSPLEEEDKQIETQPQLVNMDISSPSSTQSSSSDHELFDPDLTATPTPRVETNKIHESVVQDLKPAENEKKRHMESSSDSDSSDSSDTETTKSDNADHRCSSSSDSSSSSETESEKEESKKNMKEQEGTERTETPENSSPKDRNIFSTIQQTLSPAKNVSSTYSIIPPSSNRNQGLQDRTVPKITIRLPQLSPKRDIERKRSKDDESERPKETGKHQSPVGHVLGQERTQEKLCESDQKFARDRDNTQPKEISWQGKSDEKVVVSQPVRSVIVTSSHTGPAIDDASEIKTLLLKPRETGRLKEANSPATSTSSESSTTSSGRRRQSNKADLDHSVVTSSSSGKIMTRSATQEGVTTRSSGRNSPKVAAESLTHSEKGDKPTKESSPARSGKSSPQGLEFLQSVSEKSSPKVASDMMISSGSEQASPSRSTDTPTPMVGKLTIRVGQGQGESCSQTAKGSPKGAGDSASTKTETTEERPQRITRSLRSNSQAQPANNANTDSNQDKEKEKETINVPLTRSRRNQTESAVPTEPNPVESHPRKRKMARHREPPPELLSGEPPIRPPIEQRTNPFEMFLNIRQNIAQRHKSLCPVTTKPPQGFLEYLTYRKNYVLDNSEKKKRNVIPRACPPNDLVLPLKELFQEQEIPRQKLQTRHCIEREKLTLAAEQEIMRVHANAARALANQSIPYSVCTILRDQDIYNMPDPQPPEEDGKSIRARYNGRLLLSWLRDVDDKYDKIKETLIHRQQHEVLSLYAVQKMEWECKLSELRLVDLKKPPVITLEHVPIVEVNKDFDLLPS